MQVEHAGNSGIDKRRGAGTRPARMRAGLQGDDGRAAAGLLAGRAQRKQRMAQLRPLGEARLEAQQSLDTKVEHGRVRRRAQRVEHARDRSRGKERGIARAHFDALLDELPALRRQMMRLMSGEIKGDQDMILLLSKKNAEERLAAFIYNLSRRFAQRGFSPREFRLTMTRGDIGNYLGLTVETISRLLGRFQKSGMLAVKGKYITIENSDLLAQLAGQARNVA